MVKGFLSGSGEESLFYACLPDAGEKNQFKSTCPFTRIITKATIRVYYIKPGGVHV